MQRQADEAAAFREEADERYEAALMELLAERSRTAGLEVRDGQPAGTWNAPLLPACRALGGMGAAGMQPFCLLHLHSTPEPALLPT